MPSFFVDGDLVDFPRNVALLDTNVLVAFFRPDDAYHETTRAFFELNSDYVFAVAPPVIVESCGVLAARRHATVIGSLMQWLLTPGNAIVFPTHFRPSATSAMLAAKSNWMSRRSVDFVDAYLMQVANHVTDACNISPPVPILTYDTGDYVRSARQGVRFSVVNPEDGHLLNFT